MIESTPEISVSDLMAGVARRVEEMRQGKAYPTLPAVSNVGKIATAILPLPVPARTDQIAAATQRARAASSTARWIPKPFRGLFRRQDHYNTEVLRAIESLSKTTAQLSDRLRHLTACVEVQDRSLHHLAEVRRADEAWMQAVARLNYENKERTDEKNSAVERQLGLLSNDIQSLEERAERNTEHLAVIERQNERLAAQTTNIPTELTVLRADHSGLSEILQQLRAEFNGAAEHLRCLQVQADQLDAAPAARQQFSDQLQLERSLRTQLRNDFERLEQHQTSDAVFIKAELSRQRDALQSLAKRSAASKRASVNGGETNGTIPAPVDHRLDAFYFGFENHFRGSREEIKRRLRFYLPLIENCRAGSEGRSIVDLGCGRGEWIELLRDRQWSVTGVDLNRTMIEQCKQRRLHVVEEDAVDFLRQLPENSRGAITGFHIIEHLPLDKLLDLIAETFRVLQPGGLAIFESPNCKNLTVGACSFYIDPTHRQPVFPDTAQFMFETNGFEKVGLHYLCPADPEVSELDEQSVRLRELLYGPRDFSVVGYKPAA